MIDKLLKLTWLLIVYSAKFAVFCLWLIWAILSALFTTKNTSKPAKTAPKIDYPPTKVYQYKKYKYDVSRCKNCADQIFYRKVYTRDNGTHFVNYQKAQHTVTFNSDNQTWEL